MDPKPWVGFKDFFLVITQVTFKGFFLQSKEMMNCFALITSCKRKMKLVGVIFNLQPRPDAFVIHTWLMETLFSCCLTSFVAGQVHAVFVMSGQDDRSQHL